MRDSKKRKISLAIAVLSFFLLGGVKVQAAAIQTKEGLNVKIEERGNWQENGAFASQIAVTIKNTKKKDISGWKISFQVPKGTQVSQCWGGNFKHSGNKITITGADYTKKVTSNNQVEIGGILKGKKALKISKLTVYIKGKKCIKAALKTNANTSKLSSEKNSAANQAKGQNPSKSTTKASTKTKASKTTKASKKTLIQTNTISKYSKKNTPVQLHGRLKVKGTRIVDKKGKTIQLKGVSTHGVAWFPQYVNKKAFQTLRDKWGVNTIRLAMYSDPSCGYGKDSVKLVEKGVKYATDLGMYVIIDWHILSDGNPNIYKKEAKAFFKKMAKKYKNHKNVIYEICNEPNGNVSWEYDIKPYAKTIIKTIRKYDKKAIIVVGTPTWSQDVDIVAASPIKNVKNVMYTLHFYAATHREDLQNKLKTAVKAGLPIFVTEFGICDASGNGAVDQKSADKWMKLLKKYNISYAAWNLSNKAESSALIKNSCSKLSGWKKSNLSTSGKWLLKWLKK